MPSFNTTIDDPNPLIQYLPADVWVPGCTCNDGSALQYSNGGTNTLSIVNGASASFSFNGTGVWIFGAERSNHGPYTVTLDGTSETDNGFAPDPGLFQTHLFSKSNMQQGLHNVTITNEWTNSTQQFLDIDFITWESEIGTDTENISNTDVQDTDPSFNYQPSTAWNTSPPQVGSSNGGTGHGTLSPDAYVTYTFTGDAVSIFGTVGLQNGPYTAQLDSGTTNRFNASRWVSSSQVLIYYADNLGAGQHSVVLSNQPESAGEGLNIDYAIVSTVPSVSDQSSSRVSKSNKLGCGAIAGIAIAVIAVLAILTTTVLLMRRRRASRLSEKSNLSTKAYPVDGQTTFSALHLVRDPPQDETSMSRDVLSYGPSDFPSGSEPTAPGLSQSTFTATRSTATPSNYTSHTYQLSDGSSMPNTHSPSDTGYPPGNRRPLPISPGENDIQTVPSQVRKGGALRIGPAILEGRPQDFGHITVESELPPPNYLQATEPYSATGSSRV